MQNCFYEKGLKIDGIGYKELYGYFDGDVSLDEAELDKLKSECDLLVTMVSDLSGISVSCKLENGLFTKTQTFKFASIVVDDAINAYIEAGGSYPYYKDGADIDDIESELLSGNYNCKRVK